MTPVAWVGALAWTVGLSWEATSDYQKSAFKKDPANKGRYASVKHCYYDAKIFSCHRPAISCLVVT